RLARKRPPRASQHGARSNRRWCPGLAASRVCPLDRVHHPARGEPEETSRWSARRRSKKKTGGDEEAHAASNGTAVRCHVKTLRIECSVVASETVRAMFGVHTVDERSRRRGRSNLFDSSVSVCCLSSHTTAFPSCACTIRSVIFYETPPPTVR
ncbi:unnamed protein product, partial [Ectocarpus sp. 4 AP-2014]